MGLLSRGERRRARFEICCSAPAPPPAPPSPEPRPFPSNGRCQAPNGTRHLSALQTDATTEAFADEPANPDGSRSTTYQFHGISMSALEVGVGHHRQDHERGSSKDTTTLNDEGYDAIDDGGGGGGGSATTTLQPRRRRRRRRRARAAAAAAAIVPRMFLFADIDGAPPPRRPASPCVRSLGAQRR